MTNKLISAASTRSKLSVMLILLTLALVGCPSQVKVEDVDLAEDMCFSRQGYESVSRYERGVQVAITCKDGTYIEVRRSNYKKD